MPCKPMDRVFISMRFVPLDSYPSKEILLASFPQEIEVAIGNMLAVVQMASMEVLVETYEA